MQGSVEQAASSVGMNSPCILMTNFDAGKYQFFIIAEKQVICESHSLSLALVDMIATYVLPRYFIPILLFIQHHVLDIKDDQNIVNILFSAIEE